MTAESRHVPTVSVDFADLAELIRAVHSVVIDMPRRLRRRHDNVIDIVAAIVEEVHPAIVRDRHGLLRTPAAAFSVTQRDQIVDVAVDHGHVTAYATFFPQSAGTAAHWAAWLAEHTRDALAERHITVLLS